MKKNISILILVVLITLSVIGCSNDKTIIQSAKVLIGDTRGEMIYCLIDIKENGEIEYTACDIEFSVLNNKRKIKNIHSRKTIYLSKKNKTIINDLIQKVKKTEPNSTYCASLPVEAQIDGKEYITDYYYSTISYERDDLQKLAYKLVELSPINVCYKDMTLEVPVDVGRQLTNMNFIYIESLFLLLNLIAVLTFEILRKRKIAIVLATIAILQFIVFNWNTLLSAYNWISWLISLWF